MISICTDGSDSRHCAARSSPTSALVGDELAAQWRESLPSVQMDIITDAGHDLWSRDVDAYLAVLLPFLERVSATT